MWGQLLAAAIGKLLTECAAAAAVGGAIVGLVFRGAALAWRDEKEAAVSKAERLDEKVELQAGQIEELRKKVAELENRTDYEVYAERSTREHKAILEAVGEMARAVGANTTAVEFLIKQAFPVTVFPPPQREPA